MPNNQGFAKTATAVSTIFDKISKAHYHFLSCVTFLLSFNNDFVHSHVFLYFKMMLQLVQDAGKVHLKLILTCIVTLSHDLDSNTALLQSSLIQIPS